MDEFCKKIIVPKVCWYIIFDDLVTYDNIFNNNQKINYHQVISFRVISKRFKYIVDIYLKQPHVSKHLRWKPIDWRNPKKYTHEYMHTFFMQIGPTSISSQNNLDEKFIEDHVNRFGKVGSNAWSNLSLCQDLSRDFAIRYGDKISWCNFHLNKKIKYNTHLCYNEYKRI